MFIIHESITIDDILKIELNQLLLTIPYYVEIV